MTVGSLVVLAVLCTGPENYAGDPPEHFARPGFKDINMYFAEK